MTEQAKKDLDLKAEIEKTIREALEAKGINPDTMDTAKMLVNVSKSFEQDARDAEVQDKVNAEKLLDAFEKEIAERVTTFLDSLPTKIRNNKKYLKFLVTYKEGSAGMETVLGAKGFFPISTKRAK